MKQTHIFRSAVMGIALSSLVAGVTACDSAEVGNVPPAPEHAAVQVFADARIVPAKQPVAQRAPEEIWVARVNAREITRAELDAAISLVRKTTDAALPGGDAAAESMLGTRVLQRLIDEEVLIAHVESRTDLATTEAVTNHVAAQVLALGGEDALQRYLAALGMERSAWERRTRIDFLVTQLCEVVAVDEEVLMHRWEEMTGRPALAQIYDVSSFLVPTVGIDESVASTLRADLQRAVSEVSSGADLRRAARVHGARVTHAQAEESALAPNLANAIRLAKGGPFLLTIPVGIQAYYVEALENVPSPAFVAARDALARGETGSRCAEQRRNLIADLRDEATIEYASDDLAPPASRAFK